MSLLLIVLAPLIGATVAFLAPVSRKGKAWISALAAAVPFALLTALAPPVLRGRALMSQWEWPGSADWTLALRLDGLGLLFGLLISGIGLLIVPYALYYLPRRDSLGGFYALLLVFMTAMLGIVVADHLLLLLVFWELTTLSSFLLIGYWHHRPDARESARTAFVMTAGGGLALLAGILLLGHIAGTFSISQVVTAGSAVRASPLYPAVLVFILVAVFTKSAQFPFHFWLPQAMAAPTPVSAYLHSATMVKAGVFLLARLYPVLSGTELWFFLVALTGLTTLLLGAFWALFQHDLKGLLAYSTISHLGLITFLFGLETPLGVVAALFHIVNHAIFKASLFMAAGIIDHETGTRDLRRINGLWHYMPYTSALAIVAAAAMAGVPLLNGFLSKEMFFEETLHHHRPGQWNWFLPAAALFAGIFSVAYSARFIHDTFFHGLPVNLPRYPREPPRWMKVPVEVLVAITLLVGILPSLSVGALLRAATASVIGAVPPFDLQAWGGLTPTLWMSIAALSGGTLVYALRRRLFALHAHLPRLDGQAAYQLVWVSVRTFADRFVSLMESGSLSQSLLWLLTFTLLLSASPFWSHPSPQAPLTPGDPVTAAALLILFIAASAAGVFNRRRLGLVILLSVIGLIIMLFFARFSAPDLALTQLTVEFVGIVLLLLALYRLPQSSPREPRWRTWTDAAFAVALGTAVAVLAASALSLSPQTLSAYYLANSLEAAGGRNVVNVILVDFRAFDTLGEITVLAIAAIGIRNLLQGLKPQAIEAAAVVTRLEAHPLILRQAGRQLFPLMLLVALYLLVRGHNAPGGGFIAALIAACGGILLYLAYGIVWTQQRLPWARMEILASGLLLATLTGLGSLPLLHPFLTSALFHIRIPLFGTFEWSTALIFDAAIFVTVLGTVLLILSDLSRLTEQGQGHSRGRDRS